MKITIETNPSGTDDEQGSIEIASRWRGSVRIKVTDRTGVEAKILIDKDEADAVCDAIQRAVKVSA